ncbi:MAG: hypothetical protein AMXMBFR57_17780 [Acidimicrobiia bacterium]
MIGEFRKHANLIDGPAWLGPIPSTWQLVRAKAVLRERTQKNHPNEPLLAATQTIGVVRKDRFEGRTVLPMGALELLKFVKVGDFVISLRSFQGGIEQARDQGIISPAYTVLRSVEPGHNAYLGRLFKSKPFVENLGTYVTGIRQGQNIDYERLSRSRIPLPAPDEQAAIVKFLDHADRKIRRYIRAKRKLIALLEEQKQAFIHRAVTRGLNPDAPLKPSGVPWLGDIPAHWEAMPLRRASTARCDGPFGSGLKSAHYTDGGIRVVRLQNIGHAEFKNSSAAYISADHYSTLGDHDVQEGDLLIAGLGDTKHPAGRACVAPISILPAMVKADCFRFRLRQDVLVPEFAALQLTATATVASSLLSTGATRQRTNLLSTAARFLAVPPLQEQLSIVRHIASVSAPIRRGVLLADKDVALLEELRTRLIADVVTGKVDVREAAAALPDEQEEPDIPEYADASMADEEAAETDLSAED